ncbi:hypothetical protein RJ640_007365 [Escallonia rubra]|uniref:Uncharacterized protein n=1 Tax=Escallonia rubra TaxID=112253 RepID=A0AA88RZV7_9ASTE|nr:hypothetical protein RJ640_007365 [Escallonia rubra]
MELVLSDSPLNVRGCAVLHGSAMDGNGGGEDDDVAGVDLLHEVGATTLDSSCSTADAVLPAVSPHATLDPDWAIVTLSQGFLLRAPDFSSDSEKSVLLLDCDESSDVVRRLAGQSSAHTAASSSSSSSGSRKRDKVGEVSGSSSKFAKRSRARMWRYFSTGSQVKNLHGDPILPSATTLLTLSHQEALIKVKTKSIPLAYWVKILAVYSVTDLSCDKFMGLMPLEIGNLVNTRSLKLSHNCLSGIIPTTFSNLKGIGSMDLSFNKLSGGIPSQLANTNGLGSFNVSFNNFSGMIPMQTIFKLLMSKRKSTSL